MSLSGSILRWYEKDGRRLPWRTTTDPYEILVSEIMLQQTQVNRVIPFYERWLKHFPDWRSLAVAPVAEVIKLWSGLGYNRRALVLRSIAHQVCDRGVPGSEREWLDLKGIGPYTAAALTVFALGKKAVPIDTNIRRIVGRLFLGTPFPMPNDDKVIGQQLEALMKETKEFPDVVQGLFDLASLICLKKPLCQACPVGKCCKARALFEAGGVTFPTRAAKFAGETRHRNKPFPDRIYRGRILKLVGNAPKGIRVEEFGKNFDPDFEETKDSVWVKAILGRLVRDGLVVERRRRFFLP